MPERIWLHFGQAGVQIGEQFWREMLKDWAIGTDGYPTADAPHKDRNVFFYEDEQGRYVPRAVFVDLDPDTVDKVRQSELGRLMESHQFVKGTEDSFSNFAAGKHLLSSPLIVHFLWVWFDFTQTKDIPNS